MTFKEWLLGALRSKMMWWNAFSVAIIVIGYLGGSYLITPELQVLLTGIINLILRSLTRTSLDQKVGFLKD